MRSWFIVYSFVALLVTSVNSDGTKSCFRPDAVYRICSFDGSNVSIISNAFTGAEFAKKCHEQYIEEQLGKLCDHHDHDHHHHDHDHDRDHHHAQTLNTFQRHIFGFIAVLIVSALSLVGILTLPILYKISFKYILNLFTAMAIGTLFGDAMFHLIPSVFGLHAHNHSNDHHHHNQHEHSSYSIASYQWRILLAVFTLYIFYLLEVFLHWFAHYKHDHSSGHSHHHHSNKNNETTQYTRVNIDVDIEHSHLHHNYTHHNLHQHLNTPSVYSNAKSFFNNNNSAPCTPCAYSSDLHVTTNLFGEFDGKERIATDKSDEESITPPKIYASQLSNELDHIHPIVQKLKTIKSTGWMVLFGDSIHNFADGLAISAAFSNSLMFGITTTIAVSCHELPHELGDYAILLQSGFSHCRAILWNFLSATTAIIGFIIGSYTSNSEQARQWIFAATIGMFLYIALVDLLPTLLTDGMMELKLFLVVNCGFIFGVIFMFLLAIFEDYITQITTKYLSYVTS